MASYLQARQANGTWLVRIDDIDPPREQAGATQHILHTLERYGLQADKPAQLQSNNNQRYQAALQQLSESGLLFACQCSRKTLAESGKKIYPGTCRSLGLANAGNALRVNIPDRAISFTDAVMGEQHAQTGCDIGDLVVLRRDGQFSYQLANVVDDHHDAISEVVRGADLLPDTARQIALIQLLQLTPPDYLHIPFATNEQGQKLSKQTAAGALPDDQITQTLHQAWQFLDQLSLAKGGTVSEFWGFAEKAWDPSRIPVVLSKPYNPLAAST